MMSNALPRSSAAATVSVAEVMSVAQQLPLDAQVELVEALLRGLRAILRSGVGGTELQPLGGMGEAELQVLADAVLAPDRQEELSRLLRQNSAGRLTREEERRLDTLLTAADQLALLKARAMYTLNLYHRTGEPGQ